ncbi:MAG: hypothetical protein IIT58_10690 [Treponema sp.]|nr:hypothetical protein [Treponema sp.]
MDNNEALEKFGLFREALKNHFYILTVYPIWKYYKDYYFDVKLFRSLGILRITLHNGKVTIRKKG